MSKFREMLTEATERDFQISATLSIFRSQPKLFQKIFRFIQLNLPEKERLCDLGCGYGFLSYMLGKSLGFKEACGIDINDQRIAVAEGRLNKVYRKNLEIDVLPFPDNYFNLVTSFGVLEHLRFFDNPVNEAYRILKSNGLFLVSIPNLGDWVNRIRLSLGLQPHAVVISEKAQGGVNHIHCCTLGFFKDFLENHGFMSLKVYGCKAVYRSNIILELLDNLFSKKPSLSVRFFLIAQKAKIDN